MSSLFNNLFSNAASGPSVEEKFFRQVIVDIHKVYLSENDMSNKVRVEMKDFEFNVQNVRPYSYTQQTSAFEGFKLIYNWVSNYLTTDRVKAEKPVTMLFGTIDSCEMFKHHVDGQENIIFKHPLGLFVRTEKEFGKVIKVEENSDTTKVLIARNVENNLFKTNLWVKASHLDRMKSKPELSRYFDIICRVKDDWADVEDAIKFPKK